MSDSIEPHDDHLYNFVMFNRESVEFFVRAFDFYLSILASENAEIAGDPDLEKLVSEDTRRELGLGRDKEQAERIREWISDKLEKDPDRYHVNISLSHWSVKLIKSVSLLYLSHLRNRRNVLASKPNVTANSLTAIDREISAKEEMMRTAGVFKDASVLPLLVEDQELDAGPATPALEQPLSQASRPRPVVISTIEILDRELRDRCLDLFDQFQKSGQSDRNDTVVAEASRILENRLRTILGCDSGMTAKQLVTLAFNPDKPRLVVSAVRQEQDAAHLLFLGAFGFIRNQVQHKLLDNLAPERVTQILGMFDYLISVINQAHVSEHGL